MKKTKRIISILLTAFMVFSLCLPAFAAEENTVPVINIAGIDANAVYADRNDASTRLSIPSKERIIEVFKEDIIPALIIYSAGQNTQVLAEDISAILNRELEAWFNNSDGTAKENAGAVNKYPEKISADAKLSFNYDWRGDPVEIAAELNAYIDYVIDKSGSEQIAVTCHSLGSIILVSYLTIYGGDKVSGIVLDTPALMGLKSVGDLLSGKMDIDGEALTYFLKGILGENEYAELIASLADIFDLAGIPDMFSVFFDRILDEIGPVIYKNTLVPLFACWPTVWALTPDEQTEEAKNYIFGNICKDEDYSALISRIDNYSSTVKKTVKDVLLNYDKAGKVAVISRYGYAGVPVSEAWEAMSDTVIETSSNSLGATTAALGDYFSDRYLEGKDMKYISPDKTVDASTCLFPEKTWFIKNLQHSETAVTEVLYSTLLFSAQELTADNSQISRFMYYDRADRVLIKDVTQPEKSEETSPLQKLFNFVKALIESIKNFFTRIFSK